MEGNLIKLYSSKNLGINYLISNITQYGKVLFVGTDKAKIPHLVSNFATKVGAKLIHPKEDLKVSEKKILFSDYKTKNGHQSDAIAASVFVINEIKNKLTEKISKIYKKIN